MNGTEWTNFQDVLDDFDMLSEFYDPRAQPLEPFNVDYSRLPKSSRGRGRPLESDSDDNYDFDTFDDDECGDSKQFDVNKELEVQEALRQACGVGYSNKVIENYWRPSPEENSISTRSPTPEHELKISEDEEKEIKSTNASIQSSASSPSVQLDENINSDGNCSISSKSNNTNDDIKSKSTSNGKIFRRTIPRRCAAKFSRSPDHSVTSANSTDQNNADSPTKDSSTTKLMHDPEYLRQVTSVDYDISSSDESIVVATREIVKKSQKVLSSPQKTSPNDGKRKNRTKFKPLSDIDIIVPPLAQLGVNNEYNKIPVDKELSFVGKLKSNLNPNAKPFVFNCSENSSNGNNSYELSSHNDFPKL